MESERQLVLHNEVTVFALVLVGPQICMRGKGWACACTACQGQGLGSWLLACQDLRQQSSILSAAAGCLLSKVWQSMRRAPCATIQLRLARKPVGKGLLSGVAA